MRCVAGLPLDTAIPIFAWLPMFSHKLSIFNFEGGYLVQNFFCFKGILKIMNGIQSKLWKCPFKNSECVSYT